MTPKEIGKLFEEWTSLLELKGANPFRIKAFSKAALLIKRYPKDSESLFEEIKNKNIKGLGSQILAFSEEAFYCGRIAELDQLRAEFPPGLVELFKIPGLGVKKIAALRKALNIESIEKLKAKCLAGELAEVTGFGKKTQEKLLESIAEYESYRGLLLLSEAKKLSFELRESFRGYFPEGEIEEVGELRRRTEVTRELAFVALGATKSALLDFLREHALCELSFNDKEACAYGALPSGAKLRVYLAENREQLKEKVFFLSASEEHRNHLEDISKRLGLSLKSLSSKYSDEKVYNTLGMAEIPPELRDNSRALALAKEEYARGQERLSLLCEEELKGILHCHSTYSDGIQTLEELAKTAFSLGHQYIGVSDHSQSAAYAGGLSIDKVKQQHQEIERLNEELFPFRIFKGIESDILKDGSLDYPEEVLSLFDYIIVSVHSGFSMTENEMTERIIKALRNPYSSVLGHPTGRLLKRRKAYPLSISDVLAVAAETGTAVEINCNPWRLDLDCEQAELAASLGIKIPISPDAHNEAGFSDLEYGVYLARRAGLRAEDILTTKSSIELADYFNEQRRRKRELRS